MARLTAAKRKNIPTSEFAGPNRTYPVPDRSHAIAAKAYASRYASPSERSKIDAKADRVINANKAKSTSYRKHLGM